jgi:hypothetical protein
MKTGHITQVAGAVRLRNTWRNRRINKGIIA